jgi:cation:H+ antiporter
MMAVPLDGMHRHEVLLTILQSLLGMILLLNMRYSMGEAAMIFAMWFVQFVVPSLRVEIMFVYGFLILGGLVQLFRGRRGISAFRIFARQWRRNVARPVAARG